MIGNKTVLAIIHVIIFQACVNECFGKEAYSKDSPVVKTEKCK